MNKKVLLTISIFSLFIIETNAQHEFLQEALKPLNFLVGEWKVEVNARLSKNGPWEKSEGKSTIQKILGETIFEEAIIGTREGKTFTAKSWLGNDNRTKLYQRVFADSNHGVLIVYEGSLIDKILSLEHELIVNNTPLKLRFTYTLSSHDAFSIESARSTDAGKTWDRTGFSSYSRIK